MPSRQAAPAKAPGGRVTPKPKASADVKWVNIALPDKHFKSLGLSFPWS